MIDLKNYVCTVPFKALEIHNNEYFLCCPSWLTTSFKREDYPLNEIWNSPKVQEVRESILDGSYKYCNKQLCPFLSKLITYEIVGAPFEKKDSNQHNLTKLNSITPEILMLNFDRTCNYKCPSCRVDLIVEDSNGIKRVEKTIEEINTHYSANVKTLYITGSGDPFVSVAFRNYLRTFDQKKYPKLKTIHFHTNASMWTKEMWDSMPNVHKYVTSCEISIDAGIKDTYENKTRIGGNWNNLIKNLNFINTIPTLNSIKTSFVVQDSNYMEMEIFYKLIYSIFGNKAKIFFGKITNWGTFSEGEFKLKKVWDETHPEHMLFKKEFNKVSNNLNVFHNLYEFIDNSKTLI
jgi:MoaA/NifB/PqqE/SkfB family radical SAM enzyme